MSDTGKIRRLIKDFNFDSLFEELGWDRFRRELTIVVDEGEYTLTGVREKHGFQVFHYLVPYGDSFPSAAAMTKVQRTVAKTAHENIVIFSDEAQTRQCFRVARRDDGKLLRSTGLDFHKGHSGEALAQRISKLAFSLDEEEELTIVEVANRASELYAERVTKKFFTKFQQQRDAFKDFIKGIKDVQQREWYASLMLNRLMFVYFVQKKGFLDHNLDYLRDRLAKSREVKKKFHTFYRYFLLKLFHDGLNKRETDRDPKLESLLGQVPYLNGGIFDQHRIETENTDIKIPDKAFESLFAFFDEYKWHLDDRPLRDDTEINPDVLGYIFEKYINQKQMGAYYTKEDITEYISKSTIIPYLFDEAARRNTEPFRPEREVWRLLRDDPDRYIYDAVGHGVFVDIHSSTGQNTYKKLEEPVPIPTKISAGIKDLSKRSDWNSASPAEVALPTETWRETIARRDRCMDLRRRLSAGDITSINDMITLNLDIRQFAVDVIDNCESADLLRSIYFTIAGRLEQVGKNRKIQLPLSVLDPTCGSGAFLFAALNILQPLYEACLSKMAQFVNEADQAQPVTIEDEMAALIELGESNTLEFKSTGRFDIKKSKATSNLDSDKHLEILKFSDKERQHDILKAVAAMLNAKGGDLVIGVDDEGNGFGIHHDYMFFSEDGKRNRDGYELWLTTLLISNFGKTTAGCIEISFALRDGVDVCRLKISPAPDPVLVKKGKEEIFYRRLNNSSQTLGMVEFARYRDIRFKGAIPTRVEPKLQIGKAAKKPGKKKLTDFRKILGEIETHPNGTYFVLKSIVINNLFGVDIMPEAVEICKLRLFLKLMSTVEPHYAQDNLGVEALPDIDFNIRAGNTLVGYATIEEIQESLEGTLGFEDDQLKSIQKQVKIVALNFELFRRQQTELDRHFEEEDKAALRQELRTLTEELDVFLAGDFGVEERHVRKFAEWQESHQPFHWFAEFYGIMSSGGFDVIVGNPPYLERSKLGGRYEVKRYETLKARDIYAWVVERTMAIIGSKGRLGLIIPVSFASSGSFDSLRNVVSPGSPDMWCAHFANRPGQLFSGAQNRLTILLRASEGSSNVLSTRYHRWDARNGERYNMFPCLQYVALRDLSRDFHGLYPKVGVAEAASVLRKLRSEKSLIDFACSSSKTSVYWVRVPGYFCQFFLTPPMATPEHGGERRIRGEVNSISFPDKVTQRVAHAVLNSFTYLQFYCAYTDGRHINPSDVKKFPFDYSKLSKAHCSSLAELSKNLEKSMKDNTSLWRKSGLLIESVDSKPSKQILDEIDAVLAEHFVFSAKELDYVTNYDIKYRMGIDHGDGK